MKTVAVFCIKHNRLLLFSSQIRFVSSRLSMTVECLVELYTGRVFAVAQVDNTTCPPLYGLI